MDQTADTLIADLIARGLKVKADGAKLRVRGRLDDTTRALIRTHKAELLAALTHQEDPTEPETETAPSYPVTAITRAYLEQIHPSVVEGLPLAAILDEADTADYADLQDLGMLEAFARSLVATGYLDPTRYPTAPQNAPAPDHLCGRVRCIDCQHFQPDQIGDGSGIGRCGAGRKPTHPEWPCYPRVLRWCSAYTAKASSIDINAYVVHCQQAPYDVYVGRAVPRKGLKASKWANPFRIGKDGTREEVIAKYRAWLLQQPELMAALPELRGKVLGCWCAPLPCHAHVLAELANACVHPPQPKE